MNRSLIRPLISTAVFLAILISGFACSTSDDYLDEYEGLARKLETFVKILNTNKQTEHEFHGDIALE